jgi:hypothetical protein
MFPSFATLSSHTHYRFTGNPTSSMPLHLSFIPSFYHSSLSDEVVCQLPAASGLSSVGSRIAGPWVVLLTSSSVFTCSFVILHSYTSALPAPEGPGRTMDTISRTYMKIFFRLRRDPPSPYPMFGIAIPEPPCIPAAFIPWRKYSCTAPYSIMYSGV